MIEESFGTLRYSVGTEGPRLVAEVDEGLAKYARALIPKHFGVQPPRYPPHITVVRKEATDASQELLWGAYEGEVLAFSYLSVITHDDVYFWINVWCDRLSDIRRELCLPTMSEYTRPPDGRNCFHITVANRKRA